MREKLSQSDQSRRHWMMIIAVASLVRLVYFLWFLVSPLHGYQFADHLYYRNWGMQIANGDWLGQGVFEQGPLYAYLLGIAFRWGFNETVVMGLQMLTGIAGSLLIYETGKRLFEVKTALLAALLTAIYGPLVFYECMLMKSFLLPVFTTGLLYVSLRYQGSLRPGWLWVAGALIGLACLVRENHVLYLVPMSCWVWWCGARRPVVEEGSEAVPRMRRGIHLGVLFGSLALVVLPVTLRNYSVGKEWVPVTAGGGEVMYLAHGPEANGYFHAVPFVKPSPWREHEDFRIEAERRSGQRLTRGQASGFWRRAARDEIMRSPGRSFMLTLLKGRVFLHDLEVPDSADYDLWHHYIPVMWLLPTFGWFVGLGLLGCISCLRNLGKHQLLLGLVAVHLVSVLLTYNFGRFRIGMMPLFLLLAAQGLMWLISSFQATDRVRRGGACLGIAGALLVSGWSFSTPPGYSLEAYRRKVPITMEGIKSQQDSRQKLADLRSLVVAQPDNAMFHFQLGHTYAVLGYRQEAIEHYEEAIRLAPTTAEFYTGFGFDLNRLGLPDAAAAQWQRALKLNPRDIYVHRMLGGYYQQQGDLDAAMEHYRVVIQIEPADVVAGNSLAVILVTHPDARKRNGPEALQLALRVHEEIRRSGDTNPQVLDTLAAAYAECGQWEMAVATIKEAILLAAGRGELQFSRQLQVRLEEYQARQ